MPNPNLTQVHEAYDPRWFIWTIVFLIVSGVSLVTYILLSDVPSADAGITVVHQSKTHLKK